MNLHSHITQLEYSGLIQIAQMHPELEYLFRHALVQEAAYDSLLKADRRKLHSIVGFILKDDFPANRADELLGVVAYHFHLAEEWDKALEYGQRAANQSKKIFANEEALSYYQIALDAAEKIKPNEKKRALEAIFEILSARQGVWGLMGHFEKAEKDLEQMAYIARELKDDARLADALNGLGYFYFSTTNNDPLPVLREAVEIKQRIGDKPGEADGLNTLASVLISIGLSEEAMQAYHKARAIYEAIGSEDGVARSEWSIGLSQYELFGNYEQARLLFEDSLAICRKLGMKNLECGNLMTLGACYIRMGRLEAGAAALAEAQEMAAQIGDVPAQGWIMMYQGWILRERKRYHEALRLIEKAIKIGEERKIFNLEWYARYSSSQCKILSGNPEDGLNEAVYIYNLTRNLKSWLGVRCRSTALLAEALFLTGQEEQARIRALEALADLEQLGSSVVAETAGLYLSCYKALKKMDPELAEQALQRAHDKVNAQANSMPTEEARKSFLENVSINREIFGVTNNL